MQDKLALGNLDGRRDWGFAGDYVEAMWLMMQQDKPDDFVVATGESHSVREFLDLAFDRLSSTGTSTSRSIRNSCALPRSTCFSVITSKAKRMLGWEPKTNSIS